MKSNNSINEIYSKLEEVVSFFIDLQSKLLYISEMAYEQIFSFIEKNIIISYSNLYEILLLIVSIFIFRPKQAQNIMNLLTMIKKEIQKLFTSDELIKIFGSCRRLLVYLYEDDYINIDSIKAEFLMYDDRFLLFYPEMRAHDEIQFNKSMIIVWLSQFVNGIEKVMTVEEFKEKRRIGHDPSIVSQLIRKDDIENFQKFASNTNYELNSKIPTSIFESNGLLNQSPTLIEYSAFFGSIQIFKFLLLRLETTEYFTEKSIRKLYEYSIAGGCLEIIHLVERINNNIITIDRKIIKLAITCHQNDITKYLHEKSEIPYSFDDLLLCIESSNYEMFVTIFQDDVFVDLLENCLKNPDSIEIQKLLLFSLQIENLTFLKFFLKNFKFDVNKILNISFKCLYFFLICFILFYFKWNFIFIFFSFFTVACSC